MRLPGVIGELTEHITNQREAQHRKLPAYQETELTLMRLYREDVINVTRIADVLSEWERPTHDWDEKTAWRLFNATTFALTGRVMEKPAVTTKLHQVIDGVCERVHGHAREYKTSLYARRVHSRAYAEGLAILPVWPRKGKGRLVAPLLHHRISNTYGRPPTPKGSGAPGRTVQPQLIGPHRRRDPFS